MITMSRLPGSISFGGPRGEERSQTVEKQREGLYAGFACEERVSDRRGRRGRREGVTNFDEVDCGRGVVEAVDEEGRVLVHR